MNIIAIIPCKKHSDRLPRKNTLEFCGKQLWLHSVDYAIDNNVEPVVSTDDDGIIDYCEEHGIAYYRETVDDSNLCNCIDQVLTKFECDYFVLLQPTSPIRQKGLLSQINLPEASVYTADKVKIIGHIGERFNVCYRDQDVSTRFLYHFDGNMVVVNTEWYKENHCFFNDESEYIVEDVPYSLQIDNRQQFGLLEMIYILYRNDR